MEEKLERMNAWFDAQIAACAKQQETLLADDRADEADFEKIKAIIYDIFRTVLKTAAKESKGDDGAAKRFFLLRMEQIPSAWSASYDKARQHGDAEKMRIESLKRNTAQKIRAKFTEIWEETA